MESPHNIEYKDTIIMISFTEAGSRLNGRLNKKFGALGRVCESYTVERFAGKYGLNPLKEDMKAWIGVRWGRAAFFFIGAAGIAVRYIAPWVKDKFSDSPVVVMDEKGEFVIPLLSGHVGGAVDLARFAAACTGAVGVFTTATDIQHKFAVDVFAKRNGLKIGSRELAKRISAAVLEQEKIGFYSDLEIRGEVPEGIYMCSSRELSKYKYGIAVLSEGGRHIERFQGMDILCLSERSEYVVGIGCRRGAAKEALEAGFGQVMAANQAACTQAVAFVSIDLKKEEQGLIQLAEAYGIPLVTFSARELSRVETVSSGSPFVQKVTGVDNVCERAARLFCAEGELVQPKICLEGAAFALVKKRPVLYF